MTRVTLCSILVAVGASFLLLGTAEAKCGELNQTGCAILTKARKALGDKPCGQGMREVWGQGCKCKNSYKPAGTYCVIDKPIPCPAGMTKYGQGKYCCRGGVRNANCPSGDACSIFPANALNGLRRCWSEFYWKNTNGSSPPGYVHCGGGWAVNDRTCKGVTGGMVLSLLVPGVKKLASLKKIKKLLDPIFKKIGRKPPTYTGKTPCSGPRCPSGKFATWFAQNSGNLMKALKSLKGAARTAFTMTYVTPGSPSDPISMLRLFASIFSMWPGPYQTLAAGIAAFTYPIYGVGFWAQPGYRSKY